MTSNPEFVNTMLFTTLYRDDGTVEHYDHTRGEYPPGESRALAVAHPIPEGEPIANIEEMLTFARAYIPIRELMFSKAEHEKIVSAKDTEIASLKAMHDKVASMHNDEVDRRARAEYEVLHLRHQLSSAQSEITRLTSQQNSAETKAGFPRFNSAEWKP